MKNKLLFLKLFCATVLLATFTSQAQTLDQSNTTGSQSGFLANNGVSNVSQSFVAGVTGDLTEFHIEIGDVGANYFSPGDFQFKLYAGDGITNPLLATQNFTISSAPADGYVEYIIALPAGITMVAGTTYTADIRGITGSVLVAGINPSGYPSGGLYFNNGSTVFYNNYDLWFKTYVTQPQGASLNFDGNDDIVTVNSSLGNFGISDFTIEFDIKTAQQSTYIISKRGICDNDNFLSIGLGNGRVGVETSNVNISGSSASFSGNIIVNNDMWHTISITRIAGVLTIYVDGVFDTEFIPTTPESTNVDLNNAYIMQFGGNAPCSPFGGNQVFNGNLDEIKFWDRGLSECEIRNNLNAEVPAGQTGLVAYYKCNQGIAAENNATETTLMDETGNNNGTLQNFTLNGPTSNWIIPGAVTSGIESGITTSQTNVSCNGSANGSATVNVIGGAGNYTYDWTPGTPTGDGTARVSDLSAGTWTCTITDALGCVRTQSFTITQPSALTVTPASQTNVSCYGGANGVATVNNATGGTGAYIYNWTPGNPMGDGTTTVSGLTAGIWTCTVTDENGCATSRSFTITQSSALTVTMAQTNVSCNAGSNGSATVSVSGGTLGYTYAWSNGANTATASGLEAGTYTCTITDANGCSTTTTDFTITQSSALTVTMAQTNVSCNAGSNGSATVSVSGGTPGYTYAWSNGANTATASGLGAGTYTCTITDANGCSTTTDFTITQPSALAVVSSQTNISCNGGANGTATVSVSGGTGTYDYAWSNGANIATATDLEAGTYTCTITDESGCTTSQSFTITQPSALAVVSSQTNISCNGGTNGSATVNVSGGTGAYDYLWSNGATTATITDVAAGNYAVTVTDANACTSIISVDITEPVAIDNTVAENSGVLTANEVGASYQWYECPNTLVIGETNQNFTPTTIGDYKVELTVGSCVIESNCVTVTTLGTPSFDEVNFKYYPNPTSGILTISYSKLISQVTVVNMLGQTISTKKGKDSNLTVDLSILPSATYFVRVEAEGQIKTIKIVKQ